MSLVGNAAVLLTGQLVSKLFTFSLNQLLLSYTSPNALGISQLVDFILDYTFFLSREAVRLSIAKLPKSKTNADSSTQWAINYSALTFIIYILTGLPFIYWKIASPSASKSLSSIIYPLNTTHIALAIITCVVFELFAESYYNVNQYIHLNLVTRARIESFACLTKCIVQFVSAIYVAPMLNMEKTNANAYVFGYLLGQMAYSFTYFILYVAHFSFKFQMPRKVDGKWFETNTLEYLKSIFIQQIFKNFLTVGDKFVITSLLEIDVQGYYSFISNYGSLIARMFFAPIEESTRITISSLFRGKRDERADFAELERCLKNITTIYIYLLSLLVIFAPLNTRFLLSLVFRNFHSDMIVTAFKLYWCYLVFLASNGILEALFNSLFVKKEVVNRYSLFMLVNSAVFLGTLVLLVGKLNFQLNGLIYANMLNMLLRIIYCARAISSFIKEKEQVLNTKISLNLNKYYLFVIVSLIVTVLQYWVLKGDVGNWKEFVSSAICGGILVLTIGFTEWKARKTTAKMKSS